MKKRVITISGNTCSGKTHLLNQMLTTGKFVKLITTTSRGRREGEIPGIDYDFIQCSMAEYYIDDEKFLEYNVYGHHIYGLTKYELREKLKLEGVTPVIILTPNGVVQYKDLLWGLGIDVFSIFIDCPQPLIVERLASRTFNEKDITKDVLKTVIDRAISVALTECGWDSHCEWDLILTAENEKDLFPELIKQFPIT